MAEEKEKKEEGKAEGDAAKPKSKKMLFIIIGVVVVVIAVAAVFLMGGKKKEEGVVEKPVTEEKHYTTINLPTIIVNLNDNTEFLKVSIVLEYDADIISRAEAEEHAGGGKGGGHGGGGAGEGGEKEGLPGPMAKREPMIKDAIIRTLSAKKAEEILSPEGKEKLKEELIEAINEAIGLEEGPVVGIYFNEFLIQ